MLINIDKSISETLQSASTPSNAFEKVKIALEKIAMGQKNNCHIVYGDREVIQSICNSYENMEDEGKNSLTYKVFYFVLNKVIGRSSVYNNIKNIFFANVGFWDEDVLSRREKHYITININNLDVDDFVSLFDNKTSLLGENSINDIDNYYVPIAKKYEAIRIDIAYEPDKCDDKVYKNYANKDKHFCLAFIDSDLLYAGFQREGHELSVVIPKKDKEFNEPFNCDFHIIDVRDAENLLPIDLIKKYKVANHENITAIERVENLIGNSPKMDLFIAYFDFEKGVPSKKKNDAKEKSFWANVFGTNDYIDGFDTKKKFLKICSEIEHYDINTLPSILKTEWNTIGELIKTRCCCIKYKRF